MAAADFKETQAWQSAMALAPALMELAEAMPATEELGLSWQLRQMMVEIPATVAADIAQESEKVTMLPILKLVATLELVDKIYPALDTAKARSASDKLTERILSGHFDEPVRGKAQVKPPVVRDPATGALGGPDAATSPVQPVSSAPDPAAAPHPAPASVPVLEAPAQPTVSVPVQPAADQSSPEIDVHPNSGQ